MAGNRFDRSPRLRAQGGARHGPPKAAIGARAGAGVLSTGLDEAAARQRRQTCRPWMAGCTRDAWRCSGLCDRRRALPRNRRNRGVCPVGTTNWPGTCVDLADSLAHGGACNAACDADAADACISRACACGDGLACAGGETCVSGACVGSDGCTVAPGAIACIGGVDGPIPQTCLGLPVGLLCDEVADCDDPCSRQQASPDLCICATGVRNVGAPFQSVAEATDGDVSARCVIRLPLQNGACPTGQALDRARKPAARHERGGR